MSVKRRAKALQALTHGVEMHTDRGLLVYGAVWDGSVMPERSERKARALQRLLDQMLYARHRNGLSGVDSLPEGDSESGCNWELDVSLRGSERFSVYNGEGVVLMCFDSCCLKGR